MIEYITNKTLRRDLFMDMMKSLVDALSYSHSNRVTHCDIKPRNILIFQNQSNPKRKIFKLADWGSAHVMKAQEEKIKESSFTYTPIFSSPETINKGLNRVDLYKHDIYGLGLSFLVAAGVYQKSLLDIPRDKEKDHDEFIAKLIKKHILPEYGEIIENRINQMLKFADSERFLPESGQVIL